MTDVPGLDEHDRIPGTSDVRYVPPPPDASPLRSIQGLFAYGREDRDPETVEIITYAFGEGGIDLAAALGEPGPLVSDTWPDAGKAAYRAILDHYEEVINVAFVETDDPEAADLVEYVANLRESPDASFYGLQEFPGPATSIGVINSDWFEFDGGAPALPGGILWKVMIHELGHGLGLGHPHDNGLGTSIMRGVEAPRFSFGDFDLNQGAFTVMSYNGAAGARYGITYGNYGDSLTLGALDIAALQTMYGANDTTRPGDDVYRLDMFNELGVGYATIWDTGGVDTLRYDGDREATLDLRAATLRYEEGGGGFLSEIVGVKAGRTIAHGVVIENAIGGRASDEIFGNDADNRLLGRNGFDRIEALGGDDTVHGGRLDDVLLGGAGADVLVGGSGDDAINGGAGADTIRAGAGRDSVSGQAGEDRILGGAGRDVVEGQGGDDVLVGHGGGDRLEGGAGEDRIAGGRGNDSIGGGAGDDRIRAGTGEDTILGGAGDDVIAGGRGADAFVFAANAGDDFIVDFDTAEDVLVFAIRGIGGTGDLTLSDAGDRTVILAGEVSVTLLAVGAGGLTVDNFEFVL